MHNLEKQKCDIDDIIWHLAKETGSGENLIKKNASSYHFEKAGGFLYIYQCAKTQVNFAEISLCAEEVPVEITNVSGESHLRFMNPISRVIYRNYTLTMCIRIYPKGSNNH